MTPWSLRAIGGSEPDYAAAITALATLCPWDGWIQLQGLPSGRTRFVQLKDPKVIRQAILELSDDRGVYYALNPLLGRPETSGARVGDIAGRRSLLIDVDPVKAAGFENDPAADPEHATCKALTAKVMAHLAAQGWPAPIIVDSGNGWQLVYRIELANDGFSREVIKHVLLALGARFNPLGEGIIDRTVFNANRVAKLPGTWARKGIQANDRPYRMCKLVFAPDPYETVSLELLHQVAGTVARQPPSGGDGQATAGRPAIWQLKGVVDERGHSYARKALESECGQVAIAPIGGRNNRLNQAALAIGHYVGGGLISRAEVEQLLVVAGLRAGLPQEECEKTVRSGLEAGILEPKGLPPPPPEFYDQKKTPQVSEKPEKKPLPEVLTVQAATITPKPIDWLWPKRVPKRFITIFAGRTGLGKSFVASDLAARVTRGGEIPCNGGECFQKGTVLLISEDPYEYMLAPRLIELGADLSKIHFLKWEVMAQWSLDQIELLEKAFAEAGQPVLVLIDPPTNFLGKADENSNAQMRTLLMQLVGWLVDHDCACILITHVSKSGSKTVDAIDRIIGSVAWATTARIAHSFSPDPEDEGRQLFAPAKSNLGSLGKALAYRIVPTDTLAKVEWLGECDTTADQAVVADSQRDKGTNGKPKVDPVAWLIDRFREKQSWTSDALFAKAHEDHVSRQQVFDGKKALELPKAKRMVGSMGQVEWIWSVPPDWPHLEPNKEKPPVAANGEAAF